MKRNKKIYISGPITGVPGAISAAHFARAEQDLRAAGYKYVINPRAMFEGTGLTWDEIMATPISWAPGLPLKGGTYECDYYQKD